MENLDKKLKMDLLDITLKKNLRFCLGKNNFVGRLSDGITLIQRKGS